MSTTKIEIKRGQVWELDVFDGDLTVTLTIVEVDEKAGSAVATSADGNTCYVGVHRLQQHGFLRSGHDLHVNLPLLQFQASVDLIQAASRSRESLETIRLIAVENSPFMDDVVRLCDEGLS